MCSQLCHNIGNIHSNDSVGTKLLILNVLIAMDHTTTSGLLYMPGFDFFLSNYLYSDDN